MLYHIPVFYQNFTSIVKDLCMNFPVNLKNRGNLFSSGKKNAETHVSANKKSKKKSRAVIRSGSIRDMTAIHDNLGHLPCRYLSYSSYLKKLNTAFLVERPCEETRSVY
jgi:hypothetical protein